MSEKRRVSSEPNFGLLQRTSAIVCAYVRNNQLPASELPAMIKSVHGTLDTLMDGTSIEGMNTRTSPVSIKKSVMPDHIVCLEDGKKLKMLKRHLRSRYGLSPDQYRAKWNLPANYPMVAPNYSAVRSAFAKRIGLGRMSKPTQRRKRN